MGDVNRDLLATLRDFFQAWKTRAANRPDAIQGIQGAGGAGEALALGPLTEVTDTSGTRYVRYLGTWEVVDGTPTFVRASGEDGAELPPAETLPAREMLIRIDGDIYVAYRPDIGPTPTRWLSKRTATLSTGVAYSPPADEDSTGRLYETSATLTYYSDAEQQDGNEVDLIYTQVEAANEATHFET